MLTGKKINVIHVIIFYCFVSSDYKQKLANIYNINVNMFKIKWFPAANLNQFMGLGVAVFRYENCSFTSNDSKAGNSMAG